MNAMLAQIREHGATTPERLVRALTAPAAAEVDLVEARRHREAANRWSVLYHALGGHPDEALDLARAAFAWEATPTGRAREGEGRAGD